MRHGFKITAALAVAVTTLTRFGVVVGQGPAGDTCSHSTDFERDVIGLGFAVGNYVQEDSGSFADLAELSLNQQDGEIQITGTGTIDTATVDDQTIGWIGRSLVFTPRSTAEDLVVVETHAMVKSYAEGGAGAGFDVGVFLEFDADNRIFFSLFKQQGEGRTVQLGLDENDAKRHVQATLSFENEQYRRLRLEFDPGSRLARGMVDGVVLAESTYEGRTGEFRVGLEANVRAVGDTLDARFDDFSVSWDCAAVDCIADGNSEDCNENGVPDSCDLKRGTSTDRNADGIPDECQESTGTFEFTTAGGNCVAILFRTEISSRGGEIGFTYDSNRMVPSSIQPGADFPGTQSHIFATTDASSQCSRLDSSTKGVVIGWVNEGTGVLLPPGRYELLRICFAGADTPEGGLCSPLEFVDCLGVAEAPVVNRITDETNAVALVHTVDGEVCGSDAPFRRGDPDGNGVFDIADPLFLLGCLFFGTDCPDCPDSADVNDDGKVDVSDAIAHLMWRFGGGEPPRAPFAICGFDRTQDELG